MREIFRYSFAYEALQSAVGMQKNEPFLRRSKITPGMRVLDIGCGPGTNYSLFTNCDYVGVDLSENYVNGARRRYSARFEVADATTRKWNPGEFDAVFIHSVLHHLSDDQVNSVFDRILEGLKPEGVFYLTDLVIPESTSLPRVMAQIDRGKYPRPLLRWKELLEKRFLLNWIEEFPVGFWRVETWRMFYAELQAQTPHA